MKRLNIINACVLSVSRACPPQAGTVGVSVCYLFTVFFKNLFITKRHGSMNKTRSFLTFRIVFTPGKYTQSVLISRFYLLSRFLLFKTPII